LIEIPPFNINAPELLLELIVELESVILAFDLVIENGVSIKVPESLYLLIK
jgi:hypothetical protein